MDLLLHSKICEPNYEHSSIGGHDVISDVRKKGAGRDGHQPDRQDRTAGN